MPLINTNNDKNTNSTTTPTTNPIPTVTSVTPASSAPATQPPINMNNPYNIKETKDPVEPVAKLENNPEDLNIDKKIGNLNFLQNQIDSVASDEVETIANIDVPVSSDAKAVFDALLLSSIKLNASDVHLTSNNRAVIRVDGKIQIGSSRVFNSAEILNFVNILVANRKDIDLKQQSEIDLNYVVGNRRFRVNVFKQTGNYSIAMRVIPEKIMTLEEVGMPEIVKTFSNVPNGLILVTGPTGSGKSTTIASMLNLINLTVPKHIVTLEDPIEYVFPKGVGLLEQREFGIDFTNWEKAIRALLRQDPDIVLIGEMRDLDTIESALKIAETGHLVFATLHTNSAAETINRIIDVFDNTKQEQIRIQLSSVLRAVISQRLIPISQGGRRAAVEILISTPGVKNAIRDKKVFQLDNIIQTSSDIGMLSLDQSLAKMVMQGLISKDTAKSYSLNPNQIDILLTRR